MLLSLLGSEDDLSMHQYCTDHNRVFITIMSDSSHILYKEYQLLPSNRRLRVSYDRLRKYFVYQSEKMH